MSENKDEIYTSPGECLEMVYISDHADKIKNDKCNKFNKGDLEELIFLLRCMTSVNYNIYVTLFGHWVKKKLRLFIRNN